MEIVVPALHSSSWSSWWSAWFYDTIDALYNAYTVRIIQLNKYNARNDGSDESQAFWWLGQIPERYNQCANWNADYSASTVSGTGALSLYSTTYDFTRNISQIDNGVVRYWLYRNTTFNSCIEFNDTTGDISDIDISTNATSAILANKWYIATSGGNKFLIVASGTALYSFPMDANNNIVTGTVNTYACTVITGWATIRNSRVLAAVNDDIWVAQGEQNGATVSLWIRILTVNSSWVFTSVATSGVATVVGTWSLTNTSYYWSYVYNNTCYLFAAPYRTGTTDTHIVWSLDLTSTWSVAYTNIYLAAGSPSFTTSFGGDVQMWWNWSNVILESAGNIFSVSGAWFTDTWFDAVNTGGFIRYKNTTTKMSTWSTNFYSNEWNKSFVYKWLQYGTYNTTVSASSQVCSCFLMTGANEEDTPSALVKMICTGATQASDWLDIDVNGVNYGNNVNIIWEYAAILFDAEPVAATSIKLRLNFANSNAVDKKLWFGLTGGTYAAPTGANGLSGSTSTGADVSTAGSYLDLLFI